MLRLFEEYKRLQTKEWNKNITGYEALEMKGKDLAIKVNFKNDMWLHVYYNGNNIEWY